MNALQIIGTVGAIVGMGSFLAAPDFGAICLLVSLLVFALGRMLPSAG